MTLAEVIIAPAEEADLGRILQIQQSAYQSESELYGGLLIPPLTETLEELRQLWLTGSVKVWKAVIDGLIVGTVRAVVKDGTCQIGRLAVEPVWQGQGIAARLMSEVEEDCRNCRRFELFTGHLSERNLRWYASLGYVTFQQVEASKELTLIYMEKWSKRQQTLHQVAQVLHGEGIRFGLGGSAMLAYYGIVSTVRDLDLLVAGADAEKAHALLAGLGEHRVLAPKEPFCTEHFGHYRIGNIELDMMGRLGIRHEAGIYRLEWSDEDITRVELEAGVRVPLSSLEDWYVLYQLMPNREDKVNNIEAYWGKQGVAQPRLLQQALLRELPPVVRRRMEAWLQGAGA